MSCPDLSFQTTIASVERQNLTRGPRPLVRLEDAVMEGTAFTIEEASFDASLLPEDSRTPGSEAFHRAVTNYFQKSYASIGGQLSVVFAEQGYDLSLNRYKELVHEEVEHRPPLEILAELRAIEQEILQGLEELEGMLQ
jgi:hypothetical protein